MTFNKLELFERIRALWPSEIDLSGMVINGQHVIGGQILVELYERLEASFDEDDHWNQIAIWAFHQSIPDCDEEYSVIYTKDITFEEFDRNMRENLLGDDCWKAEQEIYFGTDEIRKSREKGENSCGAR